MNAFERVMAACRFQPPDRIPRYDKFWIYPEAWKQQLGPPEALTDIAVWSPNETTFPTRQRLVKREQGSVCEIDDWGRTVRRREGCFFKEVLENPLAGPVDPERIQFDPPHLETRYAMGMANAKEAISTLEGVKHRHCVFGKTGGPYLRTTFVRGETQFLMDMAADPSFGRALAERVGAHLTAIGVEIIRRWSLYETGIWIYDDMAHNRGPMFRPETFEQVLLPAYRQMIDAYKRAGARYVFLHSDGNILRLLDMLIDAGIDGINPVERRAGMDMTTLRKKYPRLILTGGMCNTDTLINGPIARVQAEARAIIDLGRNGGVVIGTHSISPEVPLEYYLAYHETCRQYGQFEANPPERSPPVPSRPAMCRR